MQHPGPIDNTSLLIHDSTLLLKDTLKHKRYCNSFLKEELVENKDFILLPSHSYDLLKSRFGVINEI